MIFKFKLKFMVPAFALSEAYESIILRISLDPAGSENFSLFS